MWSDLRAERALRELSTLDPGAADIPEVHGRVLEILRTVVPFDGACLGAVDPDTLLITSGATFGFQPSAEENDRFVAIEFGGVEQFSFANLVARNLPVVADAGDVPAYARRDIRFNELTRLIGFRHETRLTFAVDGTCWAVGDLYRQDAADRFDDRELEFLQRATVPVGLVTRTVLRASAATPGTSSVGASVLLVGDDGRLVGVSDAARAWIEGQDDTTRSRLVLAIGAAATLARRGAPAPYTRLRVGGGWIVLHASPMSIGGNESIAVTIEQASPNDVVELLITAHGLSRRERDVCRAVLAGRSTQEIAADLFIAAHTVQDHLKSIFAKVGVRSRRELVASLS